jgi:hypothetical protein
LRATAGKLKSLCVQQAIKLREWIKSQQETTVLRSYFLSGWSRPSIALKLLREKCFGDTGGIYIHHLWLSNKPSLSVLAQNLIEKKIALPG